MAIDVVTASSLNPSVIHVFTIAPLCIAGNGAKRSLSFEVAIF
jgi:hypothetical protein